MMDRIFLKGLAVEGITGVHAWERQLPRRLLLDLEFSVEVRAAAAHDAIEDALDYSAVAAFVRERMAVLRPRLIETLAEQLASDLMRHFKPAWLRLTIHKPGAVAGVSDLGVSIERQASDYPA